MKYLIELNFFFNQLDDTKIYPINLLNEEYFENQIELISKDIFTFNILVCGKPGSGKSVLINKILGKEKALYGKGYIVLTKNISKYIHDKFPIVIYDTPGIFYDSSSYINTLISDFIKQSYSDIRKNKINCILYLIDIRNERTFSDDEIHFIRDLLNEGMNIYFVLTHAKNYGDDEFIKKVFVFDPLERFEILNFEEYICLTDLLDEKDESLKTLFKNLYDKFNSKRIRSSFNSEEKLIKKLTILSENIKENFKLLALSLENTDKTERLLLEGLIRIISNIYNKSINKNDCNILFQKLKNDFNKNNLFGSLFQIFSNSNSQKIEYISNYLIKKYNDEIANNKSIYNDYLNSYEKGINQAVQNLKEIFN